MPTIFPTRRSDPQRRQPIPLTQCFCTQYNKVNVCIKIKGLFKLTNYSSAKGVVIVTKGVFPIYPMYIGLVLMCSFKVEGFVAIAVGLHLLSIEGLDSANIILHLLNHIGAKWTVIGQKVDHPHGAGFADVQIRTVTCSSRGKENR